MRSAGILMPIFSLPSPYGVGTMGEAARDFVDFLAAAGQSSWQILPVGPTSYGDSPYQAYSTFAGNPYFIDLDDLTEEGLLDEEDYCYQDWGSDRTAVDYEKLHKNRFAVLRQACANLRRVRRADFEAFCKAEAFWLDDYALFMALKEQNGGKAWFQWPEEERLRRPLAMVAARTKLAEDIAFWQGVQYLFFRQWAALKQYANEKGISIIGDVPIYVAGDSADVWANPGQFQLNEDGLPTAVAGCPPDGFSADGQLWGNPLYDWEKMEEDDFRWWVRRVEFQFRICDTLRIDHFRGFDEYYAIPYGDETARNGKWCPGPGIHLFEALERALGERNIIAEDLGFLTPSVYALLEETGFPGMKVLEFAFDDGGDGPYLPHNYPKACVVYPGTHDNDTIVGWLDNAPEATVRYAKAYLRLNQAEGYNWGVMRAAWASPADLAVVQFQDVLGLGSEGRINTPSTLGANWKWRTLPGTYGPVLASRLRREMAVYHRLPPKKEKKAAETAE